MSNILIITCRYLPGFKDGGPVRTVKNLTDNLGDKYKFTIFCADRDMGDTKPYDNVCAGSLNKVGKAYVYYSAGERFKFGEILKLCRQNDIVYVCGMYNGFVIKSLILKKLGLIRAPLVLAPMGTFSKGALAIKAFKKKVFFKVFRFFKMYKNVIFSVTSAVEETELRDTLKIHNKCFIAEDMPRNAKPYIDTNMQNDKVVRGGSGRNALTGSECVTDTGALKIVFISRICVKKNLTYAIDVLSRVKENVIFHIYGIIEDKRYYEKCLEKLSKLPDNIKWKYMGELDSEDVPGTFFKYDVFLFPTMGENYGHVISESLSAGCIPVISDTTPWLDLKEKGCGYVLPLENIDAFAENVTQICKMTDVDIQRQKENAAAYFEEKQKKAINESGYVKMFDELLLKAGK